MPSFLLYLATLSFVPVFIGYLSFGFLGQKKIRYLGRINNDTIIIWLIITLSFFNKLIGFNQASSIVDIIPETFLMLLMYALARAFNERMVRIFVIFVLFEVGVVCLEYYLNINSFMPNLRQEFVESELLYDKRPYGLSSNTSIIALKIFLSIILLFWFKPFKNKKIALVSMVILMIGMLLTFNRTAILSLVTFFMFFYSRNMKFNRKIKFLLILFLITSIFFVIKYYDIILVQLTRGREGSSVFSGRFQIWEEFYDFFKSNFWFGNNSYKYYVDYHGRVAHAHSSFLQIFTTHGVIISVLFLLLVFRNLRKDNYIFVIPILIYSIAQYGVFWGFSIMDIVLYIFLFNKSKLILDGKKTRKTAF